MAKLAGKQPKPPMFPNSGPLHNTHMYTPQVFPTYQNNGNPDNSCHSKWLNKNTAGMGRLQSEPCRPVRSLRYFFLQLDDLIKIHHSQNVLWRTRLSLNKIIDLHITDLALHSFFMVLVFLCECRWRRAGRQTVWSSLCWWGMRSSSSTMWS